MHTPSGRPTLPSLSVRRKPRPSAAIDAASGDALLQEPHNPTRREQALWRAVIMQMFTDAFSNSRKPEALQHKREALIWLRGNSRDFCTVCDYAGYDPDYIRSLTKSVLQERKSAAIEA